MLTLFIRISFPSILFILLGTSLSSDAQVKFSKLVWSDEFNNTGLPDSTKWSYDKGRGCPENCGWGNNELQFYTDHRKENARIENGKLVIETRKEDYSGAGYTSARLVSKNKGDWKYGRIEVRAKLPAGRGMWPAIWMLPTDWEYGGWPQSGEIDIMEHVGYWQDSLFGTVHTESFNGMKGTQQSKSIYLKNMSSEFHLYAIEWAETKISFIADGREYFVFSNDQSGYRSWPFNRKFHLLLNIAVGGNWGGKYGVDDTIFPQQMEIDYIRVFQ